MFLNSGSRGKVKTWWSLNGFRRGQAFTQQQDRGICQRRHHLGERRSLWSESGKRPGTWVGIVNAIFRQQKRAARACLQDQCNSRQVGRARGLHLRWKLAECTRDPVAQRSDFE